MDVQEILGIDDRKSSSGSKDIINLIVNKFGLGIAVDIANE